MNILCYNTNRKALSVSTNFSWNFVGKLVYAGCRGVLLILIAKLGSAVMVGQFALALAVTTPVFMLADLNLRTIYATDTQDSHAFSNYLGLRTITTIAALLVITVFICVLSFDAETALIIILVGIAKGIESISDVIFGLFQKHERMDKIGVSLIIKGILSVFFMGFSLWAWQSLVYGSLGLAFAWLIILLAFDIVNAKGYENISIWVKRDILCNLIKISFPLGLVLMFTSLNSNIISYFIKWMLGSEELGYYASISYIIVVGDTIVNAMGQSISTRLSRFYADKDLHGFIRTLYYPYVIVSTISLAGLFVVGLAGGIILELLYKPDYAAYKHIFIIAMLGAVFTYMGNIINYAISSARAFKIQPVLYGIVTAAVLISCSVLVPLKGLIGAAVSSVVGAFLHFSGNILIFFKLIKDVSKSTDTNYLFSEEACLTEENYEIELIEAFEKISPDLLIEWRKILKENNNDIVFLEPDWIIKWWAAFGENYRLFLIVLKSGEEIAGIFPFMTDKKLLHKEISFIGYPQAIYMDFVSRVRYRESVISSLLEYLKSQEKRFIANFSGIPETSANYGILKKYLKEYNLHFFESNTFSPVINTEGMDYEMYCKKNLSKHDIKDLRRYEKRLMELGNLSFSDIAKGEEEAVLKLHNMRWKKKIDTSMFSSLKSQAFYMDMVHNKELNFKAFIIVLRLNNRIIAFQLGFEYNGRYLCYRSAHDELFSVYAPGKLIRKESIRRSFMNSTRVCDFGIGYEPYKYEWTDKTECTKAIQFTDRKGLTWPIYFICKLKGKAKEILKSNRSIVIFKRNTLGKVKYFLTKENILNILHLVRSSINVLGFRGWACKKIESALHNILCIRTYILAYINLKDEYFPASIQDLHTRTATVDDVKSLSILMNCPEADIMKRFYRIDQCIITYYENNPANCMWISFSAKRGNCAALNIDIEKAAVCIYETYNNNKYRNFINSSLIFDYIFNYLHNKNMDNAYITVEKSNTEILRAMRDSGFVFKKNIKLLSCFKRNKLLKIEEIEG